ncbi:uncharacterized protein BO80DRAFT_482873 [Aspergillus ibericus CBS 121593]|uniref:SnoaL-like domain-containing protein n=1 Tax=Aspergillus ibericus CBS 121593 TaxID=1448316 RepID=A0A395H9D4_9EURO|nr:hypothetical protein BO80DRAFT_482873 [Aspergillus ibericus CBS 121593]RAL04527.1 hypothetical protein BO80DRAFT_482873 [Aspergillus ibericus CBS 121593]
MRILLILLSLITLTTTHPTISSYGATLPPPPLDPPKPATSRSYPWRSRIADTTNHITKTTLYGLARTAHNQGHPHFATYLQHYLSNTGRDAPISPDDLMASLPGFRAEVHALAEFKARLAFQSLLMNPHLSSISFTSFWHEYLVTPEQSWDWYLSLGQFVYSVTGVVRVEEGGRTVSVRYKLHVFDFCDWDGERDLVIGKFRFREGEVAGLQGVGLAREFRIRGSGEVRVVEGYTPAKGFPTVDV